MTAKFKECATCYYNNHAPEICETCIHASQYESVDLEVSPDSDLDDLTEFTTQEIQ